MTEQAQQKIRDVFEKSVSNQLLIARFQLFDSSVTQKLWSVREYFRELVNLDINDLRGRTYGSRAESVDLTTGQTGLAPWSQALYGTDTQSVDSATGRELPINVPEYCRCVNRLLDGFFMNSMSALDTLAHQISTLYVLDKTPRDIYIDSVSKLLLPNHENAEVRRVIDKVLEEDWFKGFSPFRHCTTHESLINYQISVEYIQVTGKYRQPDIKLPDDPRVIPFLYTEKREAIPYCLCVLVKTESLVSEVYESVLLDIRNAGNILPIPGI